MHHTRVVLREHRRHPVPFCREVEEHEEIVLLVHHTLPLAVVDVDSRYLILRRVGANTEILESKTLAVVETVLCTRLHGVAVKHLGADIHPLGGQRHVVAVRRRAHGEEETPAHHKVAYLVGHGELQVAHLAVAELVGHGLLAAHILDVPLLSAIVGPELSVLAREVLVVQVQPVVGGQHAGHHLLVVHHIVGYLGVGQHQRHRVVPRQLVLRRIDGDLRGLVQPHGVHVNPRVGNVAQYGAALPVGDDLAGHATQLALTLDAVGIFHHERPAPIVQQPRHLHVALQRVVGYTIGFQVVALRLVHRYQYIAGFRAQRKCNKNQAYKYLSHFFFRFFSAANACLLPPQHRQPNFLITTKRNNYYSFQKNFRFSETFFLQFTKI